MKRYLFGFLCVCALGLTALVGRSDAEGGGTGGTDPCEGVACEVNECKIDGIRNVNQVSFTDVTPTSGIDYQQHMLTVAMPADEIPFMSGGAAVGDIDGDGWIDLFVTRYDDADILYRNRGDGTFEDISAGAGFTESLPTNGPIFADIDNDGDLDLYVTGLLDTRTYLYVNDGAGVFTEEAVARGVAIETPNPHVLFSASAADVDRDGWVDLHADEWFREEWRAHSRLLRGQGAAMPGMFVDVTGTAGMDFDAFVDLDQVHAFTTRFADLDNDGWPDAAVAGDFGTSRLLWNDRDGTFSDGTGPAMVATDENGMGNAIGDYDNDGDLDWFVTSIYDPDDTCAVEGCNWGTSGNRLYKNNGDRTFTDATDEADVRDGGWGWAAAFFDYDNDGDLDLAMNNGQFFPSAEGKEAPFNNDTVRLWRNDGAGAEMVEIASSVGLVHAGTGKGLLVFDYDRDGDLDVFLTTNGGAPKLFRNEGANANAWLQIRLRGEMATRDAFGTRVYATTGSVTQMREISGGSHYLTQSERVAHFGFGPDVTTVDQVRLVWPSGTEQTFTNLASNQALMIAEGNDLMPTGDGGATGSGGTGGGSGTGASSGSGGSAGSEPPYSGGGCATLGANSRSAGFVTFCSVLVVVLIARRRRD